MKFNTYHETKCDARLSFQTETRGATGTCNFYVEYVFTEITDSTLQFFQLTENLIMLPVKTVRLFLEAMAEWLGGWIIKQEVQG